MVFGNYKAQYVVVDTSAFIKNASLQDIGEKITTIPEVVDEIKSKRQLKRLVVLPYDLNIKEASPESIKYVAEFAKKTGDFPSLSSTDLKVLALTYQLEKENVGVDHLRTIPEISRTVNYCNYSPITPENIAGFYRPKKDNESSICESSNHSLTENNENELVNKMKTIDLEDHSEDEYISAESDLDDIISEVCDYEDKENGLISEKRSEINDNFECNKEHFYNEETVDNLMEKENESYENMCDDDDEDPGEKYSNEENSSDEDDGIGWINPTNIDKVKQEMDANNVEEKQVKVACLTMDFAMQNVLKQMGLNVLSLDGKVIKQMRTFILRCYACFKTTSVMTKVFCHHCGNKTLKKVAVSLDANGNQQIHINLRRPLTAKGKRFSLPRPTGGKHSNNPILCEDQPMPDQRPSRLARMKNNPLDPDYIAGYSPFVMRDVNSRSAMLGVPNRAKEMKYWMRRNPNESFGRKKRKK